MLIRNAEIIDPGETPPWGGATSDLRTTGGMIEEIGNNLQRGSGEQVINAQGGALLPGLHDHHTHLFALAAANQSLQCGPPALVSAQELAAALRAEADRLDRSGESDGWIRGVGYHESVAGELDMAQLDRICDRYAVRIQHRTGMLWTVNSLAAERLRLDQHVGLEGVECDAAGAPTGRLFRLDGWVAEQIGVRGLPEIAATSRLLASHGVTGVTDASYTNHAGLIRQYILLQAEGALLQRVRLMGDESLGDRANWMAPGIPDTGGMLELGELKLLLDEHQLPGLDQLVERIAEAHRRQRGVAVHCVTAVELLFAIEALNQAGPMEGDRIEHASEIQGGAIELLHRCGVTVVTQPHFIRERGDTYRAEIPVAQLHDLYRCGSLIDAAIPLGGGSDAPFGRPNPWISMAVAVARTTEQGIAIGENECITPERALALYTTPAAWPGGRSRSLAPGSLADFCVLDAPWRKVREDLAAVRVVATFRGGELIHDGR